MHDSTEAERMMGQLTLAQRAMLARIAQIGTLGQATLSEMEVMYAERLVAHGLVRLITVVDIASHAPVRIRQTLTYVCTPLGVAVAHLVR